jgi:type IV pilus biogenesis protein PilP
MRNDAKWILALFAATLAGLAAAESTSDALTRIEAETVLLKAREKQLEVQSNILGRQNEIALRQGAGNALPHMPTGGEPVVLGIEGLGAAIHATLELNDGSLLDVEAGDVLPNGMRVVSIRASAVVVRTRAGKNIRLAGAGTGRTNYVGEGSALMPLPPFSPAGLRGAAR